MIKCERLQESWPGGHTAAGKPPLQHDSKSVCQKRSTNYYIDPYSQYSVMIEVWKQWLGGGGVQSIRRCTWLFATPWTVVHQASLSFTISWSLLKFLSIESVMPPNHLILCCPLLLPSIFPNIRVFSNECSSHQVAQVLELQLNHLRIISGVGVQCKSLWEHKHSDHSKCPGVSISLSRAWPPDPLYSSWPLLMLLRNASDT